MSNVPYLGASLVVVDRQDTSELDSEGVDVGPVNNVLRQISAHFLRPGLDFVQYVHRCLLSECIDCVC